MKTKNCLIQQRCIFLLHFQEKWRIVFTIRIHMGQSALMAVKEAMKGEYGPYVVPEDCYFMLGDNRNSSQDSRKWKNTFLKEEDIMAKVLFRYSPDFHWYSGVNYE